MKKKIALLLALIMVFSLAACSSSSSNTTASANPSPSEAAPTAGSASEKIDSPEADLVMGTAGAGGTWYVLGAGIADIVTKYTNINLTASSTNGTVDNMRLVGTGRLDIGMTQPPADYQAVKGEDLFEGENYDNLRWMCGGHYSVGQIAVAKDSDIETIEDLAGRKIAFGTVGSGTRHIVGRGLLRLAGLDLEDLVMSDLNQQQGSEAMQDSTVEAAMFSGSIMVSGLLNLSSTMDIRVLPVPDGCIEAMQETDPTWAAAMKYVTIPGGTYKGQDEDVTTAGFITAYTCSADLDDDVVYAILEAIYTHVDELTQISASGAEYTLEGMAAGCTVTPHPGAVKWFADHGITIEDPLS